MWDFILKHVGELIFTGITGVLAAAYRSLSKRIKAQEEERKAVKEGLKNLEYLYKSYHALGGNGTGTELYNRAKALPICD